MLKLGLTSLLIAVFAACGVYALKYQVIDLESDLVRIERAVKAERIELTRLRAEWATLNRPARLARLATTHLNLEPAMPKQIASIKDVPLRSDVDLDRQSWPALVSSGVEVPLKFKPSETLALMRERHAASDLRPFRP